MRDFSDRRSGVDFEHRLLIQTRRRLEADAPFVGKTSTLGRVRPGIRGVLGGSGVERTTRGRIEVGFVLIDRRVTPLPPEGKSGSGA